MRLLCVVVKVYLTKTRTYKTFYEYIVKNFSAKAERQQFLFPTDNYSHMGSVGLWLFVT